MSYIPEPLRRLILNRAGGSCEYCLLPGRYAVKQHQVDHIYAEKHGGETIEGNLCLCCVSCNLHKGTDLCSIDPLTGDIVPLFHPRRDTWAEHFQLNGAVIEPLTAKARVTVRLLWVNDPKQIRERIVLIRTGRYP